MHFDVFYNTQQGFPSGRKKIDLSSHIPLQFLPTLPTLSPLKLNLFGKPHTMLVFYAKLSQELSYAFLA